MADPELIKVMDYILNRCDEASIEAVAAAVMRRKKELSMFGKSGLPDPKQFAKATAESLTSGGGMGIDMVRDTVKNMVTDMLHKEAPELTDEQINELLGAWMSEASNEGKAKAGQPVLASDVARLMVDQFIAFSTGSMSKDEDDELRSQLGAWPERYWQALPPVVRSVVTEYLNGSTTAVEFRGKLETALDLGCARGE
jgi:hypothetical protein